ncbi:MAG TPA: hypothetical protein VF647_11855 [Longimicrobium sp.]
MQIVHAFPSVDGITTKYVLDAGDALVECTYVDRPEKHILCFSTAVGCPVRCGFCAATPFRRRMSADEMVAQVYAVVEATVPWKVEKPVLFSAMGEGEPLLSQGAAEALLEALQRLMHLRQSSRAAVSTTAIKPHIVTWLSESAPPELKLQVSLHATTDAQRRTVIPHAAPLAEVLEAGRAFLASRPGMLEWNYVLISGLNDARSDALRLASILRPGDVVKLNRLNPVLNVAWQPSERVAEFAAILTAYGLRPEQYCTNGVDVAAACGQLKSRVALWYDRSPGVSCLHVGAR